MVNRDLVWCSAQTAQSCRPFRGCPTSRDSQLLPPVVFQGQPSMACPPLGVLSPLVPPQSRQSPVPSSFSCSSILPSVPPGLVNGPLESGRSLQSGSVSAPRSASGKFPQFVPGSAMLTVGQEKGSLCLPQSSGPLGLTGGLLEREFPALIPCAPLPVIKRQAFGAMSTGPLKVSRNKVKDMKKNLPSNRSFSGSIHDMKIHF